jgi:hypothetical protein
MTMMISTMVRVSLLAALLVAKANAFVCTFRSRTQLSSALRAEAVDLGDIVTTAKEAFADVADSMEVISDNLDGGILGSLPPDIGIAALGVLGLAVIAAAVSGGGSGSESSAGSSSSSSSPSKSSPKLQVKKTDVSIPYDAAARLAYDAWVASREEAKASEEAYASFKAMYEETVIAEVIAKQKARDLANFDPNKPTPKPRPTPPAPKPVGVVVVPVATTSRPSTSAIPFFADAKS